MVATVSEEIFNTMLKKGIILKCLALLALV